MDSDEMQSIRLKQKGFRIGAGAVLAMAVFTVLYMEFSGETPASSTLVKILMAGIFIILFRTGMPALDIACPNCKERFHGSPIAILTRADKCWKCGYPEHEAGATDMHQGDEKSSQSMGDP